MRRLCIGLFSIVAVVSSVTPSSAASPSGRVLVPSGFPQRLVISRIHVNAPVEAVRLTTAQDVRAPYRWGDVGWYSRGAKPGDVGRADLFGHVDSDCCPAVFYYLRNLKRGDTVQVVYKQGKPLTFRVLWTASYANNKVPLKFVYGPTRERGVVLSTCAGKFGHGTGYDHKLLVYARLVLPNGQLG